jgi:hypothetical protein
MLILTGLLADCVMKSYNARIVFPLFPLSVYLKVLLTFPRLLLDTPFTHSTSSNVAVIPLLDISAA